MSPTPAARRPGWDSRTRASAAKRGHDVPREPAQLLLELFGREPLGPVDHEVFETRILGLDRLDALDDVLRRATEPRLLLDTVGQGRDTRRCARGAPRAPLLVGVADEAERGEPLVALVVGRLDAPLGLLRRVGEIEAGTPDHVLAELLVMPVLGAGIAIGLHDVVENLLAVEGD